MGGDPPVSRVTWDKTYRLILSHFPTIDLFDDIADPADWDLIARAVQRTNPRLAQSYGKLDAVPVGRRISGEGASWVMAAFVYFSPDRPSRFTDGSYGVYYAGDTLNTALHEHTFHMARAYAATKEAPGWICEVRELQGSIDHDLHDLRSAAYGPYCDPDLASYPKAQGLAKSLRARGSDGVVHPSQRLPGHACIAAFWPDVVSPAQQADHYRYHWNGTRIDHVRQITGARAMIRL